MTALCDSDVRSGDLKSRSDQRGVCQKAAPIQSGSCGGKSQWSTALLPLLDKH
jgi:hypothetical protein